MKPFLLLVLAAFVALPAAPAGAVIGGRAIPPSTLPQAVRLYACSAALIAPDRLLTAGHCVASARPGANTVRIAGARYTITRWARDLRYPQDERTEASSRPFDPPHDAAVLELDRPVTGVKPLRLASGPVRAGRRARLAGFGVAVNRTGAPFGRLREATVVVRGDRDCRDALRRADRREGGEYRDPSMLCTQDPDGHAPYASGCIGDSGAPLLVRERGHWAVAGIDTWGVACGTDHGDPEVFTDLADVRALVTAAQPPWAPAPIGRPRIAGDPVVGSTLTCVPPAWLVTPDSAEIHWTGRGARSGPAYTPVSADAGEAVSCEIKAANAGGTLYFRSSAVTVRAA